MAKAPTTDVEELEEIVDLTDTNDEVEDTEEDTDTESVMTPKALAEELEINPKALRAFLRRTFPRPAGEKNTSWKLTEAQVDAAIEHFADDEDDDETESDED